MIFLLFFLRTLDIYNMFFHPKIIKNPLFRDLLWHFWESTTIIYHQSHLLINWPFSWKPFVIDFGIFMRIFFFENPVRINYHQSISIIPSTRGSSHECQSPLWGDLTFAYLFFLLYFLTFAYIIFFFFLNIDDVSSPSRRRSYICILLLFLLFMFVFVIVSFQGLD